MLIVDDYRPAARSLALLAELSGAEARIAHDGPAALRSVETFRPDVVLLDLCLPEMDGYEVCRAIRREAWGKNVVIFAVTGWGQDESRQKSREAGFNDHLVKPIDPERLRSLFREPHAADQTARHDRQTEPRSKGS